MGSAFFCDIIWYLFSALRWQRHGLRRGCSLMGWKWVVSWPVGYAGAYAALGGLFDVSVDYFRYIIERMKPVSTTSLMINRRSTNRRGGLFGRLLCVIPDGFCLAARLLVLRSIHESPACELDTGKKLKCWYLTCQFPTWWSPDLMQFRNIWNMFYMHENAKFLIFKFSKVMQQHTYLRCGG